VLVTRPEPAAAATAAKLRALGHQVVITSLLESRPLAWRVPDPLPTGVVFTSAAAARLAGDGLRRLAHLPAFAVGDATAAAVRAAGVEQVEAVGGTAAALFAELMRRGIVDLVHLAGDVRGGDAPAPLQVAVCAVYTAALVDVLPDAARPELAAGAVTLLYSPRTAAHFARLVDAAGVERAALPIAAISPAAAAAAGEGWRSVATAAAPTEAALLAAAGLACTVDPCTVHKPER